MKGLDALGAGLVSGVLAPLGRHGTIAMALSLGIALMLPGLASVFRPALLPLALAIVSITLIRVDLDRAKAGLGRPGIVALACLWLLLVAPFVILLVTMPLGKLGLPEPLRTAVIVWSACPPLASTAGIALLMRLDAPMALLITIAGMVLFPITLPPVALWLAGLAVPLDPVELGLQLAGMIAGAALVAAVCRRGLGRERLERGADALDGVMVLLMFAFALSVMDGVRTWIETSPWEAALYVGTAFAASLILQALGVVFFSPFGRERAAAVAIASGNRNMALIAGAVGATAGPEMLLFLAALQFPIYIQPALTRPLYDHFLKAARTRS